MTDDNSFKSGSIFWIIFILITFISLFFIGIWGFWENNFRAVAMGTIFSIVLVFSIVISKGEIFKLEINFRNSCMYWSIGIFFGLTVAALKKMAQGKPFIFSFFSSTTIEQSGLFATISTELPIFWEKFMNIIVIPSTEEMIFLIGLPVALIWIMNIMGEKFSLFENKIFQTIVVVAIISPLFALFHVGNLVIGFLISATIFRAILLSFYWSDREFDLIPSWTVVPSLILGIHQGINMGVAGLMNFVVVLSSEWYGWIFLIIFGAFVIVAADRIFELAIFWKKEDLNEQAEVI